MKTLLVVRHAKSSWKHPGLDDIDRPLNPRGLRDAPEMGRRLLDHGLIPDLIVCSPARRARMTSEGLRSAWPEAVPVVIEPRFYTADVKRVVDVVRNFNDQLACIMIIGHNPVWSDLISLLLGQPFDDMPTCAVAVTGFDSAQWCDTAPGKGTLLLYERPEYPARSNT